MFHFTVTSTNRGAAKRILNVWHDSRAVRGWPLVKLAGELQKAVNEELISAEAVVRALAKQTEAAQAVETEQAGDASPRDGTDAGDNSTEPETDGTKEPDNADEKPTPADERHDWESQSQLDSESDAAGGGDESNDDSGGDSAASADSDDADEGRGEEQDDESEQDAEQDNEGEPDSPPEARDDDGNLFHEKLPLVLKFLKAGLNVSLVGPTGCGKSVMSAQIAKILGRKFTTNGSVFSKYDIIGFIDGGGTYHSTPLYDSYTGGGLHCFDEKDRSSPDAVVTFNGMIDGQKQFAFPNGLQTRHPDFLAVACMNTVGHGATADYTAQKQDASAESRFVYVEMAYDHNIEKHIGPADIVQRVWAIRKACAELRINHILPSRAIAQAAAARALGKVSRRDIDKCILFKALSDDAIQQIKTQMRKDKTSV